MRTAEQLRPLFDERRVLVTGGLGFIGSSLAHALVGLGAHVVVLDALFPEYGGNRRNIAGIEDRITVMIGDMRDQRIVGNAIVGKDFIFNMVGVLSHIDSMNDPWADVEMNCVAQISLLETLRRYNPGAKVVFAGTRGQYGKARTNPVDETHKMRPTDINGVNNVGGEAYHFMYNDVYELRAVSLRLSNTYGPRHQMKSPKQGVINWFVRLAMEGAEIPIFGDGSQVRDAAYIDDVVLALLLAMASTGCDGKAYNIGAFAVPLIDIVDTIIAACGRGSRRFIEFPEEMKQIEVGNYRADHSRFSNTTGWTPRVALTDGIERTVNYYRDNQQYYW